MTPDFLFKRTTERTQPASVDWAGWIETFSSDHGLVLGLSCESGCVKQYGFYLKIQTYMLTNDNLKIY